MLGVEAKGTERLYEYRPDDFEWSVVEFKEGNLDSDEKYWIDYYKCREIGLNKKGQPVGYSFFIEFKNGVYGPWSKITPFPRKNSEKK